MPYTGQFLRQIREAKKQSLEEAEAGTHIRRHYLTALEMGNPDALPSLTHARGFVRLYAGWLGVDPAAALAAWEGTSSWPPPSAPSGASLPSPSPEGTHPQDAPLPPATTEDEPAVDQDESISAVPESAEWSPSPPAETVSGASQSRLILLEIGVTLRTQRQRLGISLADVEKHTHIRERYLEALETGDLNHLPSTVQARGMLLNYANFLSLDSDTILLRFADALQTRRLESLPSLNDRLNERMEGQTTPPQPKLPVRRFFTPDLGFSAGLLVILIIFIVWMMTQFNLSDQQPVAVTGTVPSVSDMLLATSSPAIPTPLTADTPLTAETPLASPGAETTVAATFPPQPVEEPGITALPTVAEEAGAIAAINSDPIQVYIVARERTFLRVTIDGVIKFNGRLIPGNAYPFTGSRSVEVILGSAGAVRLYYNQHELENLGQVGENALLTFTADGVVTPTPLPTFTPSPTPLETPTAPVENTEITPSVTPFIP